MVTASGLKFLFARVLVQSDNKPRQIGLDHDIHMTFSISPHGCYHALFKLQIWRSESEPFRVVLLMLRHVVDRNNDESCRLAMPVVKGRCAHVALPHTFDMDVVEYGKNLSQQNIFTMNLQT